MPNILSKFWQKRAKGDGGFTLIELLVVVVILGILIAIAIPLYLNYRKGANDAAAESDMRGAIDSLEQCYLDNGHYPKEDFAFGAPTFPYRRRPDDCYLGKQEIVISLSVGTLMQYRSAANPVKGDSYTIIDSNANGSGKWFCYNSAKGGKVQTLVPPNGSGPSGVDDADANAC